MADELRKMLNDPDQLAAFTKQAFAEADKDGSGQIDAKELEVPLNELAELMSMDKPTPEMVQEVLTSLDLDGSGKLSIEEFKSFTRLALEKMIECLEKLN